MSSCEQFSQHICGFQVWYADLDNNHGLIRGLVQKLGDAITIINSPCNFSKSRESADSLLSCLNIIHASCEMLERLKVMVLALQCRLPSTENAP
jgi:hypothetical protein